MGDKEKTQKINDILRTLENDLRTINISIEKTISQYKKSKDPETKLEFEYAISDLEDKKNELLQMINKCEEKKQGLISGNTQNNVLNTNSNNKLIKNKADFFYAEALLFEKNYKKLKMQWESKSTLKEHFLNHYTKQFLVIEGVSQEEELIKEYEEDSYKEILNALENNKILFWDINMSVYILYNEQNSFRTVFKINKKQIIVKTYLKDNATVKNAFLKKYPVLFEDGQLNPIISKYNNSNPSVKKLINNFKSHYPISGKKETKETVPLVIRNLKEYDLRQHGTPTGKDREYFINGLSGKKRDKKINKSHYFLDTLHGEKDRVYKLIEIFEKIASGNKDNKELQEQIEKIVDLIGNENEKEALNKLYELPTYSQKDEKLKQKAIRKIINNLETRQETDGILMKKTLEKKANTLLKEVSFCLNSANNKISEINKDKQEWNEPNHVKNYGLALKELQETKTTVKSTLNNIATLINEFHESGIESKEIKSLEKEYDRLITTQNRLMKAIDSCEDEKNNIINVNLLDKKNTDISKEEQTQEPPQKASGNVENKQEEQPTISDKPINSAIIILLHEEENELNFLLTKRASTMEYGGKWVCPGGKINEGEKPVDAAIRELKEETGLLISPDDILKDLNTTTSRDGKYLVYPFVAHIENISDYKRSSEIEEERWISLKNIKNAINSGKTAFSTNNALELFRRTDLFKELIDDFKGEKQDKKILKSTEYKDGHIAITKSNMTPRGSAEGIYNTLVDFVPKAGWQKPQKRKIQILELCCGTAYDVIPLVCYFGNTNFGIPNNNVKVTCLDIEKVSVYKHLENIVDKDTAKQFEKNIEFIQDNAMNLSHIVMENNLPKTFDIIIFRNPSPKMDLAISRIIKEAAIHLGENGLFIITTDIKRNNKIENTLSEFYNPEYGTFYLDKKVDK